MHCKCACRAMLVPYTGLEVEASDVHPSIKFVGAAACAGWRLRDVETTGVGLQWRISFNASLKKLEASARSTNIRLTKWLRVAQASVLEIWKADRKSAAVRDRARAMAAALAAANGAASLGRFEGGGNLRETFRGWR